MDSKVLCKLPAPWLDHGFVEHMMKKSENDETIKVQSVSGKIATSKGDNFLSDIIRVIVKFTRGLASDGINEQKSFIFKVERNQEETSNGDLSIITGTFDLEIKMMTNTLIGMTKILNEEDVRFGPQVYHTKIGKPSFIAMEDLGALGFRMAVRQNGLDLRHCKLVLQRLAKFHATSVAFQEKNPYVTDWYATHFYETCSEEMNALITNGMICLARESAKWTDLDPRISEKLSKLAKISYEKAVEYVRAREDEFNVITHGDCWINNTMFRYNDEGEVIDQIFIDFQLSNWSSPTIDLLYFLATNANDDVANHHEELLHEYLNTLISTMSRINCRTKPPSMESLRESLRKRQLLTIIFSAVCLHFVMAEHAEAIELPDLMNVTSTGPVPCTFKGLRFRQKLTKRLREWDSQGFLEVSRYTKSFVRE